MLATAAPVVGSLVMWAVTGSPFALVFAFLGPVVAVGSLVDDRRHGRRDSRAESLRFTAEVEATLEKIRVAHDDEREARLAGVLHPHRTLGSASRDPEWWRQAWDGPIMVCLGLGAARSSVVVEASPVSGRPDVEEAYAMLAAAAATMADGPILADARDGIGIIGPRIPAAALARSIVAQLAFQLSPEDSAVDVAAAGCFSWARGLPHTGTAVGTPPNRVVFRPTQDSPAAPVVCVVADGTELVPRECRVLIRLSLDGSARVERNPSGPVGGDFRPWFLSESQANALARHAAACAEADNLVPSGGALPDAVAFSELPPADGLTDALPSAFSVGAGGAVVVDLVHDGPHAVIGGMTGSGKSELLVSWVLALATTCSPAEVNLLLVDFKGGSSFAPISALPHTVGVITDLDEAGARRALTSLRAELRHRERALAAAGARSLADLRGGDRMPRLVIVVDEFAVVVQEFPDLQALFADLAARGRSLGIHLILCTQRPAGVIRDAVLSNCSLRLSLRVNNGADSTAVIGTPAAAELPARPYGRCLLSIGGTAPVAVQVALATDADADGVKRLHGAVTPVRRPWCDPLPPDIPLDVAASHCDRPGIPFGLADIPELQSQPAAVYDPEVDGNLVILGGLGSGKTGALAALAAAGERQSRLIVRIPGDVEGAWDSVTDAVTSHAGVGAPAALYLLDDVDILLGRFAGDHQSAFAELLARLLREVTGDGSRTALTASRVTPGIQSLVAACDSRIILGMPNRQEHLLAGGDPAEYRARPVPGAGHWRGHPVQIAHAPVVPAVAADRPPSQVLVGTAFALVAPTARAIADRIRASRQAPWAGAEVIDISAPVQGGDTVAVTSASSGQPCIVFGDPGAWQAKWSQFSAIRAVVQVVFTGCSVAEFRSLTGIRHLPPPIDRAPGTAWVLARDGSIRRVRLPAGWLADGAGQ